MVPFNEADIVDPESLSPLRGLINKSRESPHSLRCGLPAFTAPRFFFLRDEVVTTVSPMRQHGDLDSSRNIAAER
jgi:hypothetical protein